MLKGNTNHVTYTTSPRTHLRISQKLNHGVDLFGDTENGSGNVDEICVHIEGVYFAGKWHTCWHTSHILQN